MDFNNSTVFQYASTSTRQRCWCIEWTWLVSQPTWKNTSSNVSHLRPVQLDHRYCLSRDWPLISQFSPLSRSFSYAALVIWNSLPTDVVLCDSEHSFKRHLKTFLFNNCHQIVWLIRHQRFSSLLQAYMALYKCAYYYGRPLSVSGRPCYILPMFLFIYLFFLWPPYSPALVNGGSRKFYMWWTLSGIREVTIWIFSWSSLNYRVGQKVAKFCVFSDRTRKLSALTPKRSRIL